MDEIKPNYNKDHSTKNLPDSQKLSNEGDYADCNQQHGANQVKQGDGSSTQIDNSDNKQGLNYMYELVKTKDKLINELQERLITCVKMKPPTTHTPGKQKQGLKIAVVLVGMLLIGLATPQGKMVLSHQHQAEKAQKAKEKILDASPIRLAIALEKQQVHLPKEQEKTNHQDPAVKSQSLIASNQPSKVQKPKTKDQPSNTNHQSPDPLPENPMLEHRIAQSRATAIKPAIGKSLVHFSDNESIVIAWQVADSTLINHSLKMIILNDPFSAPKVIRDHITESRPFVFKKSDFSKGVWYIEVIKSKTLETLYTDKFIVR